MFEGKVLRKVTRVAFGLAGMISEQSALGACPTSRDECRLFSEFEDKRLGVSHFLGRLITAPVARIVLER